jgi:uncharacterized protein
MRVVVDTNVFISAGLKENSPPEMAIHLVAANHLFLKSAITEQALFVTLGRPRLMPLIDQRFRDWLRELMATAELVDITERIAACRDVRDDKFLDLAVNGRADLIVTGDRDLLVLTPFRGIPIVTPADFMQSGGR